MRTHVGPKKEDTYSNLNMKYRKRITEIADYLLFDVDAAIESGDDISVYKSLERLDKGASALHKLCDVADYLEPHGGGE